MIVLIDGPDGSGKTTLCDLLRKNGFEYIHLSKERKVNNLYNNLILYLESNKNNKDVVIDRAYISNIIYSNVFNDSEYISLDNLQKIHNLVDCIILTIPKDREKYLKHFDKLKGDRPELYSSMEKVYDSYKCKDSYNFLLQDKPYYIYDMFIDTPDNVYNFITQGEANNEN